LTDLVKMTFMRNERCGSEVVQVRIRFDEAKEFDALFRHRLFLLLPQLVVVACEMKDAMNQKLAVSLIKAHAPIDGLPSSRVAGDDHVPQQRGDKGGLAIIHGKGENIRRGILSSVLAVDLQHFGIIYEGEGEFPIM